MNSPTSILPSLVRNLRRSIVYLLAGFALAVFHFRDLTAPLDWALQAGLFVGGGLLGLLVFVFQDTFEKAATQLGTALADNPLQNAEDIPYAGRQNVVPTASPVPSPNIAAVPPASQPAQASGRSALKQHLILVVLPIVGIYVVSSTGSALGQGFLFGISTVYLADILSFLQSRPSDFPEVYFPTKPIPNQAVQLLMIWFGLYMAVFAIAYLAI